MARQPVKHRASSRAWLDSALKEKKFNALDKFISLYHEATTVGERTTLLTMVWDRLYPKARPEDGDGNVENTPAAIPITYDPNDPKQVQALLLIARGAPTKAAE